MKINHFHLMSELGGLDFPFSNQPLPMNELPGSWDIKRRNAAHHCKKPYPEQAEVPVWDFYIIRGNGTGCRFHPNKTNRKISFTELEDRSGRSSYATGPPHKDTPRKFQTTLGITYEERLNNPRTGGGGGGGGGPAPPRPPPPPPPPPPSPPPRSGDGGGGNTGNTRGGGGYSHGGGNAGTRGGGGDNHGGGNAGSAPSTTGGGALAVRGGGKATEEPKEHRPTTFCNQASQRPRSTSDPAEPGAAPGSASYGDGDAESWTQAQDRALDAAIMKAWPIARVVWISPGTGGNSPGRRKHVFQENALADGARIDFYRGTIADDLINVDWSNLLRRLPHYEALVGNIWKVSTQLGVGPVSKSCIGTRGNAMELIVGLAWAAWTNGGALPEGHEIQWNGAQGAWQEVWNHFRERGFTPATGIPAVAGAAGVEPRVWEVLD